MEIQGQIVKVKMNLMFYTEREKSNDLTDFAV